MDKNSKINVSVSLYVYTALIFIVALLMIVLAFFGQSNLERGQEIHAEGKSIAEKSAALSSENLVLQTRVSELEALITTKDAQIASEQEKNNISSRLLSAQVLVNIKNYGEANKVLLSIDKETLSGDLLEIYNTLEKIISQK